MSEQKARKIIGISKAKHLGLLATLVLLAVTIQPAKSMDAQTPFDVSMSAAWATRSSRVVAGASQLAPDSNPQKPDWTAGGDQESSWFGVSVSTVGDVNGDGYSDAVVGAMGYDSGQTDEGKVFAYYGSKTGLLTTPNWTAEGNQEGALFGASVATAGDVNGDGFSDIIIGARSYNNGQRAGGRVFVYYGSARGLSDTPNWTTSGDQDGELFGVSVSTAGDVDNDGFSDVIIGASWHDSRETDVGRVFVYYGSASGLSSAPDWMAEGSQAHAFFGGSVATAGDVNGEGYSDVIIGAYGFDDEQGMQGQAFVYHGSANGLLSTPNWMAEGDRGGACFGGSVSTAGDVNKDGYSDIIVGSSESCGGTDRAFVFHGSATGLSAAPAWSAESYQEESGFGDAVAVAGDVNGDGYSDVIVGARRYDSGQEDEGQVFVYCGSAAGLSITPNWTAEGDQALAYFGGSVATAGDVNNDGNSDVIIGAWFYDSGQAEEGQAFVYHGQEQMAPDGTYGVLWFLVIFGMLAAYFGLRTLRIFPTLLRLLAALKSGAVKWPGPRVHDPDPKVNLGRQRLGLSSEHLFPTFIWHTSVVMAAFVFSMLTFLSNTPLLAGYVRTKWTWALAILMFVAYIGAVLSSRRVDRIMVQVNILLSDLAGGVEPRQIDGRSAEAEYAIEHPLIPHQVPRSSSDRALNLYRESLTYLQSGNQRRATILYQEAMSIDPSLHKRARETLSNMARGSSPTDAGPIYYWLGVHSEYLGDFQQAAVWYEKAIDAFGQLGYEKRQGRAHCNLGNVQMRLGNSSLAMEEFEKAIALNPKDGTAHLNIGMVYYRISDPGDSRHERALDAFADAIVADPETYGPIIISRLRSIGYTWKEDLEEITKRVETRRRLRYWRQ